MDSQTVEFIKAHIDDDVTSLLLRKSGNSEVDMGFVCLQIECRKAIKYKLPTWFLNNELEFPSKLSTEQCSSESCAMYKSLLAIGDTLCDMTGGLGVDTWCFSRRMKRVTYIERNDKYAQVAVNNFRYLGADNISVVCSDSLEALKTLPTFDSIYIDPARRGDCNKKVYAFSDCEPNIVAVKDQILNKCKRLIVKASPMLDVSESLRLLPETKNVYVLSVKNECKELLFSVEADGKVGDDVNIHCVNLESSDEEFVFKLSEERASKALISNSLEKYIFEPNASILKAGAFKSICTKFNMYKLHINSHLYTSSIVFENFPGRIFEVLDVLEYRSLKGLNKTYPKANIAVRNFPLTVQEIRTMSKIKDGGDIYMFATTILNDKKVIVVCKKYYV